MSALWTCTPVSNPPPPTEREGERSTWTDTSRPRQAFSCVLCFVCVESVHDRTPIFLGSYDDVEEIEQYMAKHKDEIAPHLVYI